MIPDRRPLDAAAFAAMVLLTALWGFQQVAIKVTAPDVSLVMQAAIRSILAAALLLAWAKARGIALFERDGTLAPGIAAGLLFGAEFVFIYAGLEYTNASRMIVFVYLAPPLTALGLHFLVRGERLVPGQWAGVLLAFAGLALAFSEGFSSGAGATFLGDLFGVIAALLWAATTVLIRATRLARTTATKTLFYQLAVSAVMLPVASVLLGERGVVALTPLAAASLAYQGAMVAFASYLAWFWLLTRYYAARLSVLSFLAPMFGVVFGVAFLGEPLTPLFALAAALVGAGIALVNLRR
ncbi:MAG: multidrug DMT transporter permease [Betaproteobacteria bacterium RIFCSPLOWO2_12_FULL_68_20]|nr:MAG: multidrug DMT transporter permease [Betaproteobacteria bacterium RIFCSPLOWO2_12_FULL_68_20]